MGESAVEWLGGDSGCGRLGRCTTDRRVRWGWNGGGRWSGWSLWNLIAGFGIVLGRSEAEDIVDLEDDGAAFGVRKLAFRVLEWGEGSAGVGAGGAIFLEEHGFAAGPCEGVDEADEGGGITAELLIEEGSTVICDFRILIFALGRFSIRGVVDSRILIFACAGFVRLARGC